MPTLKSLCLHWIERIAAGRAFGRPFSLRITSVDLHEEEITMAKGEYRAYCVKCKKFIQINSYEDYRPTFFPAVGGEKLRCSACGDVTVYTADRIVHREGGQDFPAQLPSSAVPKN